MKFNVTKQEIQQQFHLPLEEAAKALGICASVLKRSCRQNGIKRWPYRKIRSLNKRKSALENTTKTMYDQFKKMKAELDEVNKEKRDILSSIGADDLDEEGDDLDIDDLETVDNDPSEHTSGTPHVQDTVLPVIAPPPSLPTVEELTNQQQYQQQQLYHQNQQQLDPYVSQLQQSGNTMQQQQQYPQQKLYHQTQQQLPKYNDTVPPSRGLPGIEQLFASIDDSSSSSSDNRSADNALQLMNNSPAYITDMSGKIIWISDAAHQLNIMDSVGSNIMNYAYNTSSTHRVYETILKGQYQYAQVDVIIPTIKPASPTSTVSNNQSSYHYYMCIHVVKSGSLGYIWNVTYRGFSGLPHERVIPKKSLFPQPASPATMLYNNNAIPPTATVADFSLHSVNAYLVDLK